MQRRKVYIMNKCIPRQAPPGTKMATVYFDMQHSADATRLLSGLSLQDERYGKFSIEPVSRPG